MEISRKNVYFLAWPFWFLAVDPTKDLSNEMKRECRESREIAVDCHLFDKKCFGLILKLFLLCDILQNRPVTWHQPYFCTTPEIENTNVKTSCIFFRCKTNQIKSVAQHFCLKSCSHVSPRTDSHPPCFRKIFSELYSSRSQPSDTTDPTGWPLTKQSNIKVRDHDRVPPPGYIFNIYADT